MRTEPASSTSGVELRLRSLHLRPIHAADLPLLREFVRHLSPDTSYKRLLSPRMPMEDELRRWSAIDASREGAVVAIDKGPNGERLVGVARYVMQSPDETDFAIVLADAWQRRGLGRRLMARLIASARAHGVRELSGIALSTNFGMRSLARALGFEVTRTSDALVVKLSLDLSHPDASTLARDATSTSPSGADQLSSPSP